jgi:hypothetical protein
MNLKQDTAATIVFSGVRSSIDGTSLISGVVTGDITIELYKNGSRSTVSRTITELADGSLSVVLTTDDTDTLGRLEITLLDPDVFLPVSKEFMVMDADVYDASYGSGVYENSAIALKTTVKANDPQGLGVDEYFSVLAGSANADEYNNMVVSVTDITGSVTASRRVVDYYNYGGDMVIRVDFPFEFNLAAGDIVRIWANAYSGELGSAAVDEIVQGLCEEPLDSHNDIGTLAGKIGSIDAGIYL